MELKALVEQELQQNVVLEEVPTSDTEQIEKAKSEDGADGTPGDAGRNCRMGCHV